MGVSDGGPHAPLEEGAGVAGGRLSQLLLSVLEGWGAAQSAGCGVDLGDSCWAGGMGRSVSPACWAVPWSSSGM